MSQSSFGSRAAANRRLPFSAGIRSSPSPAIRSTGVGETFPITAAGSIFLTFVWK
jgi:hypothetical protein